MHLLAAILDPANNGFDISDLSVLVGILVAVGGLLFAGLKWNSDRMAARHAAERAELEDRIKSAIDERTQSIQPGYRNEGTSLTDVAYELRYVRERLDQHLDWHLEKE